MKVSLVKRTCPTCSQPVSKANPSARYCSVKCATWVDGYVSAARKLGLPAVKIPPRSIYERDNYICYLCEERTSVLGDISGEGPSLDHVIPFSAPGCPGHVPENVRTAHRACNAAKGSRPLTPALRERIRRRARVPREVAVRRIAERAAVKAFGRWESTKREVDRLAAMNALAELEPSRWANLA